MKDAAIFFAGLVVGHVLGTVYGAALQKGIEKKQTAPTFMNGEG